jgi:predicted dehydrogenase
MPVLADEAATYGYTAENRHMVKSFLAGRQPDETWDDGLEVTRVLMACYLSAERGRALRFPDPALETFIPAVAQGTWKP